MTGQPVFTEYRSQAETTIRFATDAGIGLFPAAYASKGTDVKAWPEMAPEDALAVTVSELRTKRINIAGRTGNGVAVIDLDAKNGCDPEATLTLLLERIETAVIAIVQTSRGYHIWLAITTSVGNGFCSSIGGEILSGTHLAMLPPSVHPDGHNYEWVQKPRRATKRLDLTELGLVPDTPTFTANRSSKRTPASPEVRSEFVALMAEKGISQDRHVQDLVRCPWHDDRNPSLSINWGTALFHCFAEGCGVAGGVGALHRLMGKHTPTYQQERPRFPVGKLGCVDDEVERLAEGLASLGLTDKARQVRDCRRVFAVGRCTGCANLPAYPLSCGHPLCLRCMPGRLAAGWKEHEGSIPEGLNLVRLVPRDFWGLDRAALKKIRNRFREWKKRSHIEAGLYGIRLHPRHGAVILLALPVGLPLPASTLAFEVELISTNQSSNDYLHWLQDEYAEEAQAWETDDDLALLLEHTRRRRRFQGFGGSYAAAEAADDADDGPDPNIETQTTPEPLCKVSGGSNSSGGKRDVRLCPQCGGRVEMFDFTVRLDEVRLRDGQLQWLGPPGAREAAA